MPSKKTYKIVRPKSLIDPNFADYEYLLRWVGRDGSEYLYMFYDAEFSNGVNGDVVNQELESSIQSINRDVERTISLKCDDVTEISLNIFFQLIENPFIIRLKKDGTTERYAPVKNSFSYRKMGLRYEIEFTLQRSDLPTWS